MTALIFLILVILLIVQSRSQHDREQKAYRRGYDDGYQRLQPEAGSLNLSAENSTPSASTATQPAQTSALVEAQQLADKQKVKLQTLNITLYAASLLLVAGIVLFTETIIANQAALFVLAWAILAAYYGIGLMLYRASRPLKPVAVAFVGTALAALPFVGILFTTVLDMTGSSAWLLTSMVGLIAYAYASVRLRSQVLGYATIAVLLSCGLSMMSVIGAGIVWFFVVTLALAVAVNLLASQLLPDTGLAYIIEPLAVVGRWLPPATLLMSVLLAGELVAYDYGLIWTTAGLYYLMRAVGQKSEADSRSENWIMARIVLSIAVLFYSYAVTSSVETLTIVAAAVGALQAGISVYAVKRWRLDTDLQLQNEVSLWFGLGLSLAAPLLLSFGPDSAESARTVSLIALATAVLASLSYAWLLRRIDIAYIATAALVFLPGLAVYHFVVDPSASTYAWSYLEVVLVATAVRIWRESSVSLPERVFYHITIGSTGLLGVIALLSSDNMSVQIAGLSLMALTYYALTWYDRMPWIALAGNAMLIVVMRAIFDAAGLTVVEIVGLISLVATVLFASIFILLRHLDDRLSSLSTVFLVSSVVSGVFFGLLSVASTGGYAYLAMLAMMISGSLLVANRQKFGGSIGLLIGGIVATLAMQRLFALSVPDIAMLFYAHWWAVVLWLLGYLEYQAGNKRYAVAYGYSGLGLVSLYGLGYALSGNSVWYQALFIVEHSLLLLVGLVRSWRQVTIWGAVGVTLAVLWMFRGYTSLFLTLIGIMIILAVIWIVRRESAKS